MLSSHLRTNPQNIFQWQNSWCCCAQVICWVINILTGCNSGSCVSKRSADTWTEGKSCRTSRMLHSFSNFQSSYRLLPWVKKDIKKKKKTFSQFIIKQSFRKRGWPGLALRTGRRGFSPGYCEHYPPATLRGNKRKMEHTEPRGTPIKNWRGWSAENSN